MINSTEAQSTRIIGTLAIAPNIEAEADKDFISETLAKMQSESDGIDILLEMVKKNKLDPWNIDVVELADQYFAKTVELRINNLHVTSRVILFACISLYVTIHNGFLEYSFKPATRLIPPTPIKPDNDIGLFLFSICFLFVEVRFFV